LCGVKIFIKVRPRVIEKSLVHLLDQWQLIANNTTGNGKDWQDAALVTRRAVIVALTELPASLDSDSSVPHIRPKIIFKVNVRRRVRIGNRGYNRNIARAQASARVGDAKLYPLLRELLASVSRNDN